MRALAIDLIGKLILRKLSCSNHSSHLVSRFLDEVLNFGDNEVLPRYDIQMT